MSQSAMSGVGSATTRSGTGVGGDDGERLRRAVLSGPGATVVADDAWLTGVLGLLVSADVVAAALAGHVDVRRRVLTGVVTVVAIFGLCLFRRDNYDVVLARVTGALPGVLAPGDRPPTGQALSQARARLMGEPVRAVFEATAAVPSQPTPGCHLFGLLVTAFDGTVLDLAGTDQIAAVFATPSGGRYPQARLVTLVACGTRRVLAAAADSCEISEQALVDRLADALGAGTLNLADRNFFSMARWVAFTGWRPGTGVNRRARFRLW